MGLLFATTECVVSQWLFINIETDDLEMLEWHFALNTVFRVKSFSVDALVLRHDCFKIDGYAHTLSEAKI